MTRRAKARASKNGLPADKAKDDRETRENLEEVLLGDLMKGQREAVTSPKRRLLIIAGAGSGKTEVIARRIAWWVAVEKVPKDEIIAFTFTEAAAEEMKFRIRKFLQKVTPPGESTTLGGMYIGTIHSFCIMMLRDLDSATYHNYDILDDAARLALVQRGYYNVLGLEGLRMKSGVGRYAAIDRFLHTYDLLNEYNLFDVKLPSSPIPHRPEEETEWCKGAETTVDLGSDAVAKAFAKSAARYYAYLKCRRFLDFSTSQSELVKLLASRPILGELRKRFTHLVVDEVQDINPVQSEVIRLIVGTKGHLTAVGDHRQAIFGWRGARVEIMGELHEELSKDTDGQVVELTHNFRSTPRIISLANSWADTIGDVRTMRKPAMKHGNKRRKDLDLSHLSIASFGTREDEADWIACTIRHLIPDKKTGALHDTLEDNRGIALSDVAVLVRSSTHARAYMEALRRHGIPAVFRAGPDLFSQPEVLLFLGVLALCTETEEFWGDNPQSIPARVQEVLGCRPEGREIIRNACRVLEEDGVPLAEGTADRLIAAATLLGRRLAGLPPAPKGELSRFHNPELREYLARPRAPRRVFPQAIYQMFLAEAGVGSWEDAPHGESLLFHLGALSTLIKGMETPGWTAPDEFKYQVIALSAWGAKNARTEEAPLLVDVDAVSISTIHRAKGMQYPVVFLADVGPRSFPSGYARTKPKLFCAGGAAGKLRPEDMADNENYDDERRLMYVALTRAERYLFVSCSGKRRSRFFRELTELFSKVGGRACRDEDIALRGVEHLPSRVRRHSRLVTSFSDLRYYFACPHDFYYRKVLGFAPVIDQAFGYGRGVHNLLREIHTDPKKWAEMSRGEIGTEIDKLIKKGLFYLRYTTGPPARNMEAAGREAVARYVECFSRELAELTFEAECEFETLLEEQDVLISGAIDLVRRDDPPQVTLIDFKSGSPADPHDDGSGSRQLDEAEMQLQVSLYALAAKKELQYKPNTALVRYLGRQEDSDGVAEQQVQLDDKSLDKARKRVLKGVEAIQRREFDRGPTRQWPTTKEDAPRCARCDWCAFCGRAEAKEHRASASRRR